MWNGKGRPPQNPTDADLAVLQGIYNRESVDYRMPLVPCQGPMPKPDTCSCPYALKVRKGKGWCFYCLPRTQIVR